MYVFLYTFNKREMQEFCQERNGLNQKPVGPFHLSVSSITWRKTVSFTFPTISISTITNQRKRCKRMGSEPCCLAAY